MNYEEMLAAAEDKQSYHLLDELPNEYNGKDTLATGRIKDNYIYVLVHDGQLNSLNNGEPISAEYFLIKQHMINMLTQKLGISIQRS